MNTHINPHSVSGAGWLRVEIETLERMVADKKTDTQIAEALGRTPNAVKKQRTRMGIVSYFAATSWTPDRVEQLRTLFERGLSDAEIGEAMGKTTIAIAAQRQERGMVRVQRLSARLPATLKGLRPCPINAEPEERARANAAYLLAGIRAGHDVYKLESLPALYRARDEA